MPTEKLNIGPVSNLVQNTIYALPAASVFAYSTTALEISNTTSTTSFTLVSGVSNTTTGGVKINAQFVRCTVSATLVTLKRD